MTQDVFSDAMILVFSHEGGWSNDPDDPGGATNMGITLNTFVNWLKKTEEYYDNPKSEIIETIKNLTKSQAEEIYLNQFWIPSKADLIEYSKLAIKYFDLLVNVGQHHAVKELQSACNDLSLSIKIMNDGIIGPTTLMVVNSLSPDQLLEKFMQHMENYYRARVAVDPVKKKYLAGWLHRVRDFEGK